MSERNGFKRLGDIFWDTDLRAIEAGLNLLAYWWAVCLLTPGPIFDRPGYVVLRAVFGATDLSEAGLGGVFLALAIAHTLAPRRGWAHQAVLVVGGWLWGVVAISGILMWPLPAYSGGYLLVAAASAWLCARTTVEGTRHD